MRRQILKEGWDPRWKAFVQSYGSPALDAPARTPAATGQLPRARAAFERVLAVRNDVGLLSEQWDPDAGRQLGNAPQAFSHIALVETAFMLTSPSAEALTVSRSDAAPTPRTPAG
ncbi:glycoside hydrolase family 15 protein [Streptomyces aquilus]|uniref:glycoside hydrolase family 15 protein n=1 Tax=Streptomyces aquilus TaxID=2548456 RepID=UPI001FCABF15|nr:glycoside hydrolase family 15 protein [Streptomyces aquilus]